MPDNPPHDRNNTARRDFICLVQAEVESSATPFVTSKNPVAASENQCAGNGSVCSISQKMESGRGSESISG